MSMLTEQLSRVRSGTWLRWGIVVGGLSVVFVVHALWAPDGDAVRSRLEQKYGVEEVSWSEGFKTHPAQLVVDGRDLSEPCAVQGTWGSLDDLEIVCIRDVGIGRVEQP